MLNISSIHSLLWKASPGSPQTAKNTHTSPRKKKKKGATPHVCGHLDFQRTEPLFFCSHMIHKTADRPDSVLGSSWLFGLHLGGFGDKTQFCWGSLGTLGLHFETSPTQNPKRMRILSAPPRAQRPRRRRATGRNPGPKRQIGRAQIWAARFQIPRKKVTHF